MLKIQNDKTPSVGLLARQSDTISAAAACNVGVVDTNVCCAISLADQTLTLRRAFVDIIDVSVRRIAALYSVSR